jgi:hypothetical protein
VLELFHTINDRDSATARLLLMELGLKEAVDFRNIAYASHAQVFAERGGTTLPALWDGQTLHQGLAAVSEMLRRVAA